MTENLAEWQRMVRALRQEQCMEHAEVAWELEITRKHLRAILGGGSTHPYGPEFMTRVLRDLRYPFDGL